MIKRILFLLLLTPLIFTAPIQNAEADIEVYTPDQSVVVESKALDPRGQILRDYLAKHNSPLQFHAQDFIDAADTYNVDWKLVPAIAGVESTFGKHTPGGGYAGPSYNGWGWGVYGNQALYFGSWRAGIFTVTKGLKEGYIDKGLTDPYSMNRKYASSQAWGKNVAFFLNDIDTFAKNYPKNRTAEAQTQQIEPVIAGNSANTNSFYTQLALLK